MKHGMIIRLLQKYLTAVQSKCINSKPVLLYIHYSYWSYECEMHSCDHMKSIIVIYCLHVSIWCLFLILCSLYLLLYLYAPCFSSLSFPSYVSQYSNWKWHVGHTHCVYPTLSSLLCSCFIPCSSSPLICSFHCTPVLLPINIHGLVLY